MRWLTQTDSEGVRSVRDAAELGVTKCHQRAARDQARQRGRSHQEHLIRAAGPSRLALRRWFHAL